MLRYCYVENGTIQSEKYKVNSRNKIREVIEILSIHTQTNKKNYQKRPELPVWFQESGAWMHEPGHRQQKRTEEKARAAGIGGTVENGQPVSDEPAPDREEDRFQL